MLARPLPGLPAQAAAITPTEVLLGAGRSLTSTSIELTLDDYGRCEAIVVTEASNPMSENTELPEGTIVLTDAQL
jgi:hypothetical protein